VADVLGTGSEILLLLCLLVTPLSLLTRQRWFIPMRRWYGVMLALSAATDATIASITTSFSGGVLGRIAGHSFLLTGLVMVALLLPLAVIANAYAQRVLGRYWKILQRATYVIWGLLWVHLALLEGLGFEHADSGKGDGLGLFHQRMYQLSAVSLFLLAPRIPPVRRWITGRQNAGKAWQAWLALSPLIALALVGYAFIEHEFFFKGYDLFRQVPSNN
jgi:DMSO/TMAO reductase YedYZ heme-binding membrane subunit